MQVKEIVFFNRAPFSELRLSLEQNSVSVLSGINGKGKTTVLSYIMDSWVEITRDVFGKTYEGKSNSYYRVSSSLYTIDDDKPSLVYIRYEHEGVNYDYIDVRGNLSIEEYDAIILFDDKIPFLSIDKLLKHGPVAKVKDGKLNRDIVREIFNGQVDIYMPSYRSEVPNYLNNSYSFTPKYTIAGRWGDEMINPLEVVSGLESFSIWIMDLLLDRYVNQQQKEENGQIKDLTPELRVWNNVVRLLQESLSSKYPRENVRFGIARRNNSAQRIAIMDSEKDEVLCPSIFNLSTGEQAVLVMFGEIIRQGDNCNPNISLNEISGIVLIDEIDKHLHMKLQKEVLPRLIQLFPKIQFIVSSHSPFFNMGLSELEQSRSRVIDLDNEGIISEPANNMIYKEAYESFLNERINYAAMYHALLKQIQGKEKPLVITEGKTDIKIIQKAYEKLGEKVSFDVLSEEEQPDGCSNLDSMLTQLSLIKQKNKIICIFDSDVKTYVDKYGDDGHWNKNNVFAFCLPVPESRIEKGQKSISIEYLFSDNEIQSFLPDGTRLFFGNEFEKTSRRRHNIDKTLFLSLPKGCGEDRIIENNGGQAVFKDGSDDNLLGKKDDFAEAVVNERIQISDESWENFRKVIEIIQHILSL